MPIFDQGYQHWSGTLSGHAWRWLAITRLGVRIDFKNRYLRLVILSAWMPAIVLVTMLCVWGLVERNSDLIMSCVGLLRNMFGRQSVADPKHFRVDVWTVCYNYFLQTELWFALIVVLLVGPNLVSADLRFNALPLYFSRPLRRIDYFMGKLGVITTFIALIIVVPSVVAYIFGLLFSLDITIIKDTYRILLGSVVYGCIIAFSAGLLMLALSSLSRNSRYVALFWIGLLMVGSVVSSVLESVEMHERMRAGSNASVAQQMDAWKQDWRPLLSYKANLSRIGEQLLGTSQSWENLYQAMPAHERFQSFTKILSPQYPWYWSAIVLLVLFGLSACILNLRIKSLDRLK
jgi:ABC-2 type transport system permease protein